MKTPIHGHVEPGFGRVADAFALNFSERGERGAACTILIEGSPVVDIYAGEAGARRPWTTSSRSVMFSVSKAVTAISLLMAAD
jgi:CubicO group peptidase (beta-lactamase class C family)